jgi:electron transport complex protein RnfE
MTQENNGHSGLQVTIKKYLGQLSDGIIFDNPILVQLLGTCPTLAVTTSVSNAIGMGLAATAVLICSNMLISLLRKFIPKEIRIASYIIIIAGFVNAVELLIKAYVPALDKSLGVFIPLITVNCIILARAEAFASKNKVLPSVVDGLAMGLGFTFALMLLASIREVIGSGTWLGIDIFGPTYKPATLFIMPSGAFISLGFLIAAVNKVINLIKTAKKKRIEKFTDIHDDIKAQSEKIPGINDNHQASVQIIVGDYNTIVDKDTPNNGSETPPDEGNNSKNG